MTIGDGFGLKTAGNFLRRAAAAGLVLCLAWFFPPYCHRVRHLCPERSDGIGQALGLPAFARKYGMSCSQCHADFPILNYYGRQFKMNGYVRAPGSTDGVFQSQDQQLWTEAIMPWAAIIRSRPLDTGHGEADTGTQMGNSYGKTSNGPLFEPINDIDLFLAGGDAAKRVSYFGELDDNLPAGISPNMGDLRLGYHPSSAYNFVLMRRGFFVDDPYQTIASAESPTIAGRATDLLMNGQTYLSGFPINAAAQTFEIYGRRDLPKSPSFLYYAAGASKDPGNNSGAGPASGYFRFAYDGGGFMAGTFGQYGRTGPIDTENPGTTANLPGGGTTASANHFVQEIRGGLDALWEHDDFYARAAYVYAHDSDARMGAVESDQAAYAEIFYTYKRDYNDYAFLVPLLRENYLTLFNGAERFSYVTAQIAHYFAPNFKGFIEYTVDTGRGYASGLAGMNAGGAATAILPMGNRLTAQLEIGF